MSISDDEFRRWCKSPTAQPVWTLELDYQDEDGGEPTTRTLLVSNRPYRLGDGRYYAILAQDPQFSRSLGGEGHATYAASYGAATLHSYGGEFDWLLDAAVDGSQARWRYGDASWPISDHRLIFVSRSVGVARADTQTIEIDQQDLGLLLNKRINGEILIGGTGPNADKPRTFNFGYVRQVECFLVDQATLTWAHSDTGQNTIALDVRVRMEPVSFTDNGDGTVTLDASPPTSGVVTATVLALPPDVDPSDVDRIRVSDLIDVTVGLRSGLIADGTYAGAHPTFVVGDAEDYPIGVSIGQPTNTLDFLKDASITGQFAWAITRTGEFTYMRIRPNDVATLPMTPFDVRKGDVSFEEGVALTHEPPLSYRIRAHANLNWKLTDDIAGDVIDSEQYATVTRVGLPVEQDDAVGDTYADRPELYDLTLVESPFIDTWISDADDATAEAITRSWMEVERFNGLPWLERVENVTVGMEFFDRELGDVCRFVFDRFGYDAGELTQVIGIGLTGSKIQFTLYRRRLSQHYPIGWERVTTSEDATVESSFVFDSVAPPTVVPPPPSNPLGVTGAPWYPGNLNGSLSFSPFDTSVSMCIRHAFESAQGFYPDTDSEIIRPALSFTSDGIYCVWSDSSYTTDGDHQGIIHVLKRTGGIYAEVAAFQPGAWTFTHGAIGQSLDISDDLTIVCSVVPAPSAGGDNIYVFSSIGPDAWSTGTSVSASFSPFWNDSVKISDSGNRIAVHDTVNGQITVFTGSGTSWAQSQILSASSGSYTDCAISADGNMVVGNNYAFPSETVIDVWELSGTWVKTQSIAMGDTAIGGSNEQASNDNAIALASDKSTIIASGALHYNGTNYAGGVFVLTGGPSAFAKVATITGLGPDGSDFGASLAIANNGELAVVGEPLFDTGTTNVGRAYYVNCTNELSGTQSIGAVTTAAEIANPFGSTAQYRFGTSVGVAGDGSAIAAAGADQSSAGLPALHVYYNETEFLLENFNGSGGWDARVPDTGLAWDSSYVILNGNLQDATVSGGFLTMPASSRNEALSTTVPPSADYAVECSFHIPVADINYAVVGGRFISNNVTGATDGYYLDCFAGTTGTLSFTISSLVGGVSTIIANLDNHTPASDDFVMRLQMTGTQLTAFLDDVQIMAASDSNVAGAGAVYVHLAAGSLGTSKLDRVRASA